MKFFLTHLYPQEMNIYGDMGNIIALTRRLEFMGYQVAYQTLNQNSNLPKQTDFYFMGGGQDKEQEVIYQDLLKHKAQLIQDIQRGVGLLAICGGYQLLGKYFVTGKGNMVEGLDIFPVQTKALGEDVKQRCIGNLVESCLIPELKSTKLVGFENHGGQTYFLEKKQQSDFQKMAYPLGNVLVGFGNNSVEKIEGCVLKAAVGTYLHGSCLPKNPQLADWLIKKSLAAKANLENPGLINSEQLTMNNTDQLNESVDTQGSLNNTHKIGDEISLATQSSLIQRFLG